MATHLIYLTKKISQQPQVLKTISVTWYETEKRKVASE